MVNFLALIGWNPGTEQEIFTKDELISIFDIDKIQKSGGAFNDDKLDWMNKEHMKKMNDDDIHNEIISRLSNHGINGDVNLLKKISKIVFEHISKWGDIDDMVREGELSFYFNSPEYDTSLLSWKGDSLENSKKHLERIVEEKDIAAGDPGEDDHDAEGVVGERFQYGDPLHVGDDIAREDFGRPVIIELLEGEGVHLLAGHIPDIREIDSIDRDEADEENRDIFLGIGGGEFQGLSP
jgi:hypothetical protein